MPNNRQSGDEVPYPPGLAGFHVFAIDLTPDRISWFVDGKAFATRQAHDWATTGSAAPGAPFHRPFHLILNRAIGGHLPERRGTGGVDSTGFPRELRIDWVRVWQKPVAAARLQAAEPTGKAGS